MSDEQRLNQTNLVQSGNRGLMTRSSALVRRGLETLLAQQTRIVHFPLDRSMGTLYIRDLDNPSEGWKEFGEAKGNVTVPSGKELRLRVCEEVGHGLILIKDAQGEVIGFERLYFKPKAYPQELGVVLQTTKAEF